ncbi:MFS transporter [Nesterenkonia sp. CL21]|uniref:MFS transporter n=1 Tax=Nesterenkonia sp. CL21 TaxID=3064894 RepID=UPI002879579F|nr:MFS transporter [Nesterenkonia sp. CL21]MDS2173898.1 MFS transporter [Nesterenkonia sp. CL21]
MRKVVLAGGLGTLVEYFDYASYSYVATTLAVVFFAQGDPAVALLSTFAIFAVSFVVRPVGALFWGMLGDRLGRKRILATTILVMSGATVAIGLIPPYAVIGVAAPVLLLFFRMVQSFSAAGEYAGAGTYIAEFAPNRSRGFMTSAVPMAASAGFLLASFTATVLYSSLSSDAMESWGWRVPFLIAGPLGMITLYLRYRLEETPYFREVMDAREEREAQVTKQAKAEKEAQKQAQTRQDRASARSSFWANAPGMTRLLLVMALNAGAYYLLLAYTPTFLIEEAGMSQSDSSMVVTISLVVFTLMIPFAARFSDRIGRKRALLAACVGLMLFAYPMMFIFSLGSMPLAVLALVAALAIFTLNDAVFPSFFAESLSTRSRYVGFALPFNLGAALFGGVAPYTGTWLIQTTGSPYSPALFLIAVALLSMVGVLLSKDRSRRNLPTEVPR